ASRPGGWQRGGAHPGHHAGARRDGAGAERVPGAWEVAGGDAGRAGRTARATRARHHQVTKTYTRFWVALGRGLLQGREDVARKIEHLGSPGPEAALAPLTEATPHVVSVDLQGVADVLEREEPGAVSRIHPLLRLLEDLPPARIAGVSILLVA